MPEVSAPVLPSCLGVRERYFRNAILPVFERTLASVPPIEKRYRIAGSRVRVLFLNPVLAETMSHALSHNEITTDETGEPDLTIYAMDSAAAGVPLRPPQNEEEGFLPTITPSDDTWNERFYAAYVGGECAISAYDASNHTAYFWTDDASSLMDWVTAAPFRPIFHWFLSGRGVHLMHGAVIRFEGKAALLTAKGGSGKSTTALSCLMAGMEYLADDYIAVSASGIAYSLYSSVKIMTHQMEAFPELASWVWNPDRPDPDVNKAIIFLTAAYPERICLEATLDAILIPSIQHADETLVKPASKIEAMLAVLPTTLLQLPLFARRTPDDIRSIIAAIPCYRLELGREVREVPDALKRFLASGV